MVHIRFNHHLLTAALTITALSIYGLLWVQHGSACHIYPRCSLFCIIVFLCFSLLCLPCLSLKMIVARPLCLHNLFHQLDLAFLCNHITTVVGV
jgi:hypothetical protein